MKTGQIAHLNIAIVKKYDSIPPYIRLVNNVVRNGEGTVYISEINDETGLAQIRAHEFDFLGDVTVPINSLSPLNERVAI